MTRRNRNALPIVLAGTTPAKRARRRNQRLRRNQLLRELKVKCGGGLRPQPQPRGGGGGGGGSGLRNWLDFQDLDLDAPVPAMSASGAYRGATAPGMPVTGGLTPDGAAWVLKALHPNGEEVTKVTGIPDHVSIPVVSPEFRNNVVIGPRADAVDTDNDDLDILVLPFGDLVALYRRYKTGTVMNRRSKWVPIWNPTFSVANSYVNEITVAGTPATPESFIFPTAVSDMNSIYGFGRATYRGVTSHLDAPATRNQGRVMAGQIAIPYQSLEANTTSFGWNAAGNATRNITVDTYSMNSVPLDESCLMQASPGAQTWEASDGVYLPMMFRDPTHNFTGSGSALLACEDLGGYVAMVGAKTIVPPGGQTGTATNETFSPRMLLNGLTGVVLFRGVDSKANIHFKIRTGLECQVDTCSSISPYQRMSPILDTEAIAVVARAAQEMAQVYPAAYNDRGLLGNILNKILPGSVDLGKKIRGGIVGMNIPGLSKFMDWQNRKIYDPLGLNAPVPRRRRPRRIP